MKLWLSSMALCGMLLPLAGCETLVDTPAENQVRVSHAVAMDVKQIPGDVDRILFIDRPMWLSRYPMPGE
jgi:hypothetical protein